jgi:hypothetical protein
MRVTAILLVVLSIVSVDGLRGTAVAAETIRLAQASVTTTCMMTCNSQYANCQSSCLATGAVPNTPAATTNANPNQTCFSSCTNTQLSCQINCSRAAPSQ